ncbi:16S rRNA (cytosine(1402)-N(4))-methyltransferase [Tersicoccus phoenicis]|uniref:Ribosomal RNA small subunit methyltransferase H n=1 Tax=Tersicoccus phoenicis TaxID=554083 RepID=A0A1R1L9S9_9MICC|nr:16S rRNA (cytosine(1402)-N(4))-methyltransferase RsmH [Tersicoccus phoenicis]OMH24263.1 16S rRNA (cytosine(1402)-N(4))-methyltransferase [Tersicoccus phoenicis]
MTGQTPASMRHTPVLLSRTLDLLAPALAHAGAVALDATLGMGGHSEAMLSRFPHLHLVGVDRDPQALGLAGERLARFGGRVTLIKAVYDEVPAVLARAGVDHLDGVLYDLGVSSLQLDETERGFAYAHDAPLDMRMDTTSGITARELVNTADEADLVRIIRRWGEEKFAGRIARAIVAARTVGELATTGQLVEVIRSAVPAAAARTGGHPAKRTFQALRIAVNDELDVLERAIPAALGALDLHGRIVVLSYHSLEDGIAKRELAAASRSSAPRGFPVELPEHQPHFRLLTKGTETPSEQEVAANPRAASARLRAAERIAERPAARHADRHTGRHTDRHTDRRTDRSGA